MKKETKKVTSVAAKKAPAKKSTAKVTKAKPIKKEKAEVALELKSFSKRYGRNKNYSVKDLNFQVRAGEFHGFVGANGAGKTTTIKSIIGAYAKYEGEVEIYGMKNTLRKAKELIGYIPEAADFPKGFSTMSYLSRMAIMSGMKGSEARAYAKEQLEKLGLTSIAKRSPNNLSSGQKKKVLLAQALIHKPKVIIMDEPAANLDPQARTEFFKTLKDLAKEGVTIFISSHILDELQKYIDSVTIVDGGQIVYSGNLDSIGLDAINPKGNEFVLRTFDADKTEAVLTKAKVKHVKEGVFFNFKTTQTTMAKILTDLSKAKVPVSQITAKGTDLASVYDRFVKVGSLDVNGKNGSKGVKNA